MSVSLFMMYKKSATNFLNYETQQSVVLQKYVRDEIDNTIFNTQIPVYAMEITYKLSLFILH